MEKRALEEVLDSDKKRQKADPLKNKRELEEKEPLSCELHFQLNV